LVLFLAGIADGLAQFGGFGGGSSGRSSSRGTTRQYPNSGEIGEAMISSDPETRRIIVITDEETSQHISQVITNLDRPKPQVLIKVVFLEVTHGKGSDIGIEGSYRHSLGSKTSGALTNSFNQMPGIEQIGAGGLFYRILNRDDFEVTMQALASADKTEVLSRPSILARNNQQAVITIGQTLPFITGTRFDTVGNQINTVQYQDIGIILRVTPFITSDGLVEMIVAPEISTANYAQKVTIMAGPAGGVGVPVIDKRAAETVVVTADGLPVIIGGLMENKQTESVKKVPLLGDIPLLGLAFQRRQKLNNKTELIMILTPHIVREPSQIAALSERERSQSQLTPKAFSQQELDRFIAGLPVKKEITPVQPVAPLPTSPQPAPANSFSDRGKH